MIRKEIISNPYLNLEKGKAISVSEDLIKRDIDFLVIKERFKGRELPYALANSSIEIIFTHKEILQQILNELKIS